MNQKLSDLRAVALVGHGVAAKLDGAGDPAVQQRRQKHHRLFPDPGQYPLFPERHAFRLPERKDKADAGAVLDTGAEKLPEFAETGFQLAGREDRDCRSCRSVHGRDLRR